MVKLQKQLILGALKNRRKNLILTLSDIFKDKDFCFTTFDDAINKEPISVWSASGNVQFDHLRAINSAIDKLGTKDDNIKFDYTEIYQIVQALLEKHLSEKESEFLLDKLIQLWSNEN